MPFTRQEIALAAGALRYWVAGEGPAVLYVHAAGGPMMTRFLEELSSAHRVYVPILPGFDSTPTFDAVTSIPALADLLAEFVDKAIGAPADVMGASFGGWLSLWLAVRRPEAVGQLVLAAPAGLRFGMTAVSLTPEEARRNLFAYPDKAVGIAPTPEIAAANGQMYQRYNRGVLVDQELADRVHEIRARTLVLMATRDKMIPAQTGHFLVSKIPACHLTYIYDAAHALEVDQPEATLRIVRAFLERGEAFIVNFGGMAEAAI